MNTLDAIIQRRATKNFDSKYVMTLEEKKSLLNIALQNAPSAFNLQHWRPLLIKASLSEALTLSPHLHKPSPKAPQKKEWYSYPMR